MTLLELVTNLRNILEDKGGAGTDWTDSTNSHLLKWTNDELVLFINEAEKETARRLPLITDSSTSEVVNVSVTSGTAEYDLHTSITQIRRVKLGNKTNSLQGVSWKDLEALNNSWDEKTGEPSYYVLDWNTGKILLNPIPIANDTLSLSVYRLPLEDMTWANRSAAEPEVPAEYQYKMLYYAAHLAYEKDEPNTLDPARAGYMLGKFETEIGPKDSAYSQERKKRIKRRVAYGGIRMNGLSS